MALFDVIETVDREKIAAELAKEIARQGRSPKLYVQVNTGSEPQKAGIEPREAVAFVKRCRDVHGLAIDGLMCIPPVEENPGPHFALLEKLAREAGVEKLLDGHVGRLRAGGRLRRDQRPRRLGDLRQSLELAVKSSRSHWRARQCPYLVQCKDSPGD